MSAVSKIVNAYRNVPCVYEVAEVAVADYIVNSLSGRTGACCQTIKVDCFVYWDACKSAHEARTEFTNVSCCRYEFR